MKELDAQQNVLDGVIDFFKLYTSNTNIDENPLVGSIHQRVHIGDLSRGWSSQERKRQWRLGICCATNVVIITPFRKLTAIDVLELIRYHGVA